MNVTWRPQFAMQTHRDGRTNRGCADAGQDGPAHPRVTVGTCARQYSDPRARPEQRQQLTKIRPSPGRRTSGIGENRRELPRRLPTAHRLFSRWITRSVTTG
jgi:hypothetical protein